MADKPGEDQPHRVPGDGVLLLDCKFDQASLAPLRGELNRVGTVNGLTDLKLANFVIAVNEITTNAVRYAGGQGQLKLWQRGGQLWCLVADEGNGIPRRHLERSRRPYPAHVTGHGLWLARHICDSVEIESGRSSGTRVLLRYGLPPVGP
jgi:anti-sigma regulatory factor (Ser/Thr protein kinase)